MLSLRKKRKDDFLCSFVNFSGNTCGREEIPQVLGDAVVSGAKESKHNSIEKYFLI
jgi:hypothetical protein